MIIRNKIILLDFETGSRDPYTCEATEIAAMAIEPTTLEEIPNSRFTSLIKPLDMNNLEEEALRITHISREELTKAPDRKIVWKNFVDYCLRYKTGNADPWDLPYCAGHNIANYDLVIVNRLNQFYKNKNIFHPNHIDTMQLINAIFWQNSTIQRLSLDSLRDKFNLPKDNAHRAMADVEASHLLLKRVMKYLQNIGQKLVINNE